LMNDYLSCASQFKRGRVIMSATIQHATNNTSDDKKISCWDILSRTELPYTSPTPTHNSEDKDNEKYLVIISTVLSQVINRGDKLKCLHKQFRSSSGRLPPITLDAYIARLLQYAPCEKECFLAALLFMDRLSERTDFVFNSLNIHRSYLVSLLLAAKFFEDQPCDNGYFATVGGVSLQELNTMEVGFLQLLEFRVSVTSWEFSNYASHVEEHMTNMGRPKLFFVSQEASITPITPDTTNSMLMHVTPAVQMVTST